MNVGLSITLLWVAFVCRIVILNESSRVLLHRWRAAASTFVRAWLDQLWDAWKIDHYPRSGKRWLVFNPLLDCFLTLRIMLDLLTSMFLEVCSKALLSARKLTYD